MKSDRAYIDHILDAIKKIQEYTSDLSEEQFIQNDLVVDAVIRNIEIIGEASKQISRNLQQIYFEIPWKEMAGMRDKLIHDYMGVDTTVIWQTILEDLPALKDQLGKIAFSE
jgi:uncharacterized protein with HEPN domain